MVTMVTLVYSGCGLDLQAIKMAQALRWGICSAGKISHDFVVGLKTLPAANHIVKAVAARSLESAQAFARKHAIESSYGSYEELARDKEVDVVYIGTIHPAHLACAKLMIEAGKPVLCEKPLTMNARDTSSLVQLAREKKIFLMEAVWTRFFPVMVELRRIIASQEIGEVRYVNITFSFRPDKSIPRLEEPELGGGAVLDVGVYVINVASMIFGGEKPIEVHARGELTPKGVDQLVAMTLVYSGGRVAQLTCGTAYNLPCQAVICGRKGEVTIPKPFWCPTELVTPTGTKVFPLPTPYQPTNFAKSEGMCYQAEAVRHCLAQGMTECDVMSLDNTQLVADIMDEVMKQVGVVYCK